MQPVTQASIDQHVYHPVHGTLTVTDVEPAATWGVECAVTLEDGTLYRIGWFALNELYVIEVGDTVIVEDTHHDIYVGTVTTVRPQTVTAHFEGIGKRRFPYAFVSEVIASREIDALFVA